MASPTAMAWVDMTDYGVDPYPQPNGIYVTDGSYVMNVGELHLNISNFGLIGSQAPATCSWCDAPSAQWPAGSGVEYLWAAGLWVAGVTLGEQLVSTGQYETEIRAADEVEDTIYEAIGGELLRPAGNEDASGRRVPEAGNNDDEDFDPLTGLERIDEEILNGYDDDEDGLIDEDFAQIGNQMMVCTLYDNTRLASEIFPDHTPLNLKIVQNAYQWENDDADDFVGFEFQITNIGVAPINDVYIGFFADSDIGPRDRPGRAEDDMAGSFTGWVQARDNTWVPVTLGYMYDDDGDEGQSPGFFGIVFLNHDVDPTGATAPESIALHAFRHFSGQTSYDQGGDPTNDAERYETMSSPIIQPDVQAERQNDFRILISVGPFAELPPDETLEFQAAIVVGQGLPGLLANAAEAALTYYGNYFDLDGDVTTGENGRETKICQTDFPPGALFEWVADMMDVTCVPADFYLEQDRIQSEDLVDGCLYVNMDNCFECGRQAGENCSVENRLITTQWNCYDEQISDANKKGCTGIAGLETQVNWLVGMAPPPPGMRFWPRDRSVHVFWNNISESTPDVRSNKIDFESYRIWRADNWERPYGASVDNGPESGLWQLVAEYDVVNTYVETRELVDGTVVTDTLPLGHNTGLEPIRYSPVCLDDERFMSPAPGLGEAMRQVVEADSLGQFQTRPGLYDSNLQPIPELEPLLPWQGYPAELDTFFWVTPREAHAPAHVPKEAVQFYEYVDRDVHNGFLYFYSVTATDHNITINADNTVTISGEGIAGDPGSSFSDTRPGTEAQTAAERAANGANIYAYPNPATRDALEDFQQFYPNADDPTGVRVCIANLPAAQNTVKIYTLDGDLVETLEHDGSTGYGEVCWNLVSRNGQEVVSGIYLFSVESGDDRFDDFIGKFVVIR